MKFKVDENLPQDICALLKNAGFDAMSIPDQQLSGESDPKIFEVCQDEERILVSLDVGFANLRSYPPASASGILVLRLARQDKLYVIDVMQKLLPLLEKESPAKQLWIVEDDRVRIRE